MLNQQINYQKRWSRGFWILIAFRQKTNGNVFIIGAYCMCTLLLVRVHLSNLLRCCRLLRTFARVYTIYTRSSERNTLIWVDYARSSTVHGTDSQSCSYNLPNREIYVSCLSLDKQVELGFGYQRRLENGRTFSKHLISKSCACFGYGLEFFVLTIITSKEKWAIDTFTFPITIISSYR